MTLLEEIDRMFHKAASDFSDAARMHSDGKCAFASGQKNALRAVRKLIAPDENTEPKV